MSAKATSRACSVVVAVLLSAAGGAVAPARAQSLADIAKKEEDRRKSVAGASKVYTNKDLSPVPPGSPPPPSPAAQAASTSPDAAKTAEDDGKGTPSKDASGKAPVKDQAYWAGKQKTLKDALARDQDYADAMQTRINSLTTDFVNRDDPAQRAVIETNRQKSLAELARLTKSVQDDKKALADFLEEARRAGIPPGWLR